MLNFEEELEKFRPVLEIDQIENQIATEDMRDVIELIKEIQDQADRKID
ncbi:MAG: hypothetical protein U0L26_13490 [Cellulosilyticum sp.]|nr:hypothetical protein [Cellulosilyticum sp.]MEE1073371.1 hypothetical protein [Cellulosilyticum sp.]